MEGLRPPHSTIAVCQGEPHCSLHGDQAVDHQQRGCLMCKRILIYDDQPDVVVDPLELGEPA